MWLSWRDVTRGQPDNFSRLGMTLRSICMGSRWFSCRRHHQTQGCWYNPPLTALRSGISPKRIFASCGGPSYRVCYGIKIILLCINVFLALRHFCSSGRGSFLVFSAPWYAGGLPRHRVQVWALADVRGTYCGGSEVASPLGEGFRSLRAIHVHANPKPP